MEIPYTALEGSVGTRMVLLACLCASLVLGTNCKRTPGDKATTTAASSAPGAPAAARHTYLIKLR